MRENIEIITSRIISIWMITMIFLLFMTTYKNTFQIGPNPDLYILHIPIDTPSKYTAVVSFCFCNSVFRSLNHNILQSYIINSIQDIQDNLPILNSSKCYEISCISTIYNWFDFFMYMHILMSQIDLLLVEVSADIIMTIIITKYYIDKKHNYVPINI
jgi:hypothetical protein